MYLRRFGGDNTLLSEVQPNPVSKTKLEENKQQKKNGN
jgi:hypothetical protein